MDSLHGRRISQQVSKPQSTLSMTLLTTEAFNRKVRRGYAKLAKEALAVCVLRDLCEYSATSAVKAFGMSDVSAVMAVYPRPSLPCRSGQQ
jgi:hypothetical protein